MLLPDPAKHGYNKKRIVMFVTIKDEELEMDVKLKI